MDFTVKHFAGNVKYSSDGFLDKNKDTVFEDLVNVLRNGKRMPHTDRFKRFQSLL
ncbi:unconventional myosin-Ig-like [Acyrthosiphon pisum]|uniref:Myosin motor domain-containing protein n=1 Tax=Acyrthosiphon pisum TaxID=7029 RepID=A0A8R2JVG7_ACYPI|nr:unconventional myosin-Ig-like [Acyrthosiphon pisum]